MNFFALFLLFFSFTASAVYAAAQEIPVAQPLDAQISPKTPEKTLEKPAEKTAEKAPAPSTSGSYLSGQFARSSGDTNSAVRYLESVYKQDKNNPEVAGQLMGLLLLQGQVDDAMKIATDLAKVGEADGKKDPIAALMLSLQAIKNKDVLKASRILDEAFATEGGQLWLPLVSAWLDVENHKLTKPLTLEELSAEVGRAAPIVNYHLALINAQAGFTAAAAENFKQAIEDPTDPSPRVMQALLRFYEKNNAPEPLKPLVEAYRKQNPSAFSNAEPFVINNVQDGVAEVLFTMGSIMLSADATQDATLYLQLALYMKPNMGVVLLTLADAYTDMKQYGVANELFAKIPSTSPLYNNAQLHLVFNLGRMNKWNEAVIHADALIKQSPANIDPYIVKADLLRTHNHVAEAITVYTQAIDLLKDVKPQHWVLFFARGSSLEQMGKWPEAQKDLRRALELKPDQADTLNYLGFSLLTRGENIPEAKSLIEKALQQKPDDAEIIDSMGWALYLLGNYEQATEYLEKAVNLLPADATVNDHLGDLYWRLGRKTEARFQWERSLSYSPEPALEATIQKKLKEGLLPLTPAAASQSLPQAKLINAAAN